MKRPRSIKDRIAHRDALLEALHADALEGLFASGRLPEKARLAIQEKALSAREKVQARGAVAR